MMTASPKERGSARLAVVLLGICAACAGAQDVPAERWLEGVGFLQDAHRFLASAEHRTTRIDGLVRYLKKRSRDGDLTTEDRKAMRAEIKTLEQRRGELVDYQRSMRDYLVSLEKYLEELARVSSQASDWNRERRKLWKRGRPPFDLLLTPQGTVKSTQRLRAHVEGAPPGTTVKWRATLGTVMTTEGGLTGIWTPQGTATKGRIFAELEHPRIEYPVVLSSEVDRSGGYIEHPEVSDALYEEALARLISLEVGREQLAAELESLSGRLESARSRGVDESSPSFVELSARVAHLREVARHQDDMVDYLDTYRLPRIAEASGQCDHWEVQRQDLQERHAVPGRIFPWRIEPGARMSHDRWHYVVRGLPFETKVRWYLGSDVEGASPKTGVTDLDERTGIETPGVLVEPFRDRDELLVCRIELAYYDLPIRLEWRLPANPER